MPAPSKKVPHPKARTVNDCCCGTGGMLTITKDRIQQINPQAKLFLYGQELNPQTWAIPRSDMLILEPEGKDAENIKLGSTLSNDQLPDKRFDFQCVKPPYGYEWSKDNDAVTMAGFVIAKGSTSSNQSGKVDIRQTLIEADFVNCMVALSS